MFRNLNIHPNPGEISVGQAKVMRFSESNLMKSLFMGEKKEDMLLGMFRALGLSIKSYL